MPTVTPYPPGFPSVSGDTLVIPSASAFLSSPQAIAEVIRDLTDERFLSDRIFGPGPQAAGGAVAFNQITSTNLYADRDAESIRPGAHFPKAAFTAPTPSIALIEKYGLEIEITREDILRNRWDVVRDAFTVIANTVVKKVDTQAMAALDAAPLATLTGVDFTTATVAQKISVFVAARSLIEDADMGYDGMEISAYFNPTQANEILGDVELLKLLQAEGPELPARSGNFGRLMGIQSFKSNRITAGTAKFVASGIVGSISQEEGAGVLTRSYLIDEKGPEDRAVQGWRPVTFAVRHPKAAVAVTAI